MIGVTYVMRLALSLLVYSGLAGCLPIAPAHKSVFVPPLELELSRAHNDESQGYPIEIVQPHFWSPQTTLIDMLKDVPVGARHDMSQSRQSRFSRTIQIPGGSTRFFCALVRRTTFIAYRSSPIERAQRKQAFPQGDACSRKYFTSRSLALMLLIGNG